MKIMDLTKEYESLFFVCLEDWSEEMKEAGNHKCTWYNHMKDKGLGVKLAVDDGGNVGGMIQYLPIEHANAEGQDVYFIDCIWVHKHKEGRGDFSKQGMGKALLKAAEEDAQSRGAKGMVAWGVSMPFWMKASWYKKQGYKKVDKNGMALLMWKPFVEDAVIPKWIKQVKTPEANTNPGKVTLTVFYSGHCPVQNLLLERAKRVKALYEHQVVLNEINTIHQDVFREWGILDGLFIEDKQVNHGPPLTYKKLLKLVEKRLSKLP